MNRIHIDGAQLAYRDEGQGPAIVFVHGTPSSSAEFAEVITAFRDSHRCIAIDHLGFGASDKPMQADYSIAAHRDRLQQVLTRLDVQRYHLVVHDFGGPIALPMALDHPERLLSLTLMNTWLWPLQETEPSLRRQKWLMQSAFIEWLYRHWNMSARVMVKTAWGRHRPLTKEKHARYMGAFPSSSERSGTIAFLKALFDADEPAWSAWQRLDAVAGVPTQIIWGMADIITPQTLARWTGLLPAARVVRLEQVGHFVADEAPELVIDALRAFLPQRQLVPGTSGSERP